MLAVSLIVDQAQAAPVCTAEFSAVKSHVTKPVTVTFSESMPVGPRKVIEHTIQRVHALLEGENLPQRIEIKKSETLIYGGQAEINQDRIVLDQIALQMRPHVLSALIAHETTHLVVARAFKAGEKSVHELSKEDDFTYFAEIQSHVPFAELLCDVMATLITRDPRSIRSFVESVHDDPATLKVRDQIFVDSPLMLSRRDFSIPYDLTPWKTYDPKDLNYNRLNQVRAYLWNRWIRVLSPLQYKKFYSIVQSALADVFKTGMFEQVTYTSGIFRTNEMLIQLLEQRLSAAFPQ